MGGVPNDRGWSNDCLRRKNHPQDVGIYCEQSKVTAESIARVAESRYTK